MNAKPLAGVFCVAAALAPLSAAALEFEGAKGIVRARDGAKILWENAHDRGQQLRYPTTPGYLVGPVPAGEHLYYGIGVSLYQVDPRTGVVRRRIPLPAPCRSIVAD